MLRKMPANKKELIRVDVMMSKGYFNRHEISKFFETEDEAEYYVQHINDKYHDRSPKISSRIIQSVEIGSELKQINYSDRKVSRTYDDKVRAKLKKGLNDLDNYFAEVYVARSTYPRKRWHFDTATGPDKIEYIYSLNNQFHMGDIEWTLPMLLDQDPVWIEITPNTIFHVDFVEAPITICKKYADIVGRNRLTSELKDLEREHDRIVSSLDENLARIEKIKSHLALDDEKSCGLRR